MSQHASDWGTRNLGIEPAFADCTDCSHRSFNDGHNDYYLSSTDGYCSNGKVTAVEMRVAQLSVLLKIETEMAKVEGDDR